MSSPINDLALATPAPTIPCKTCGMSVPYVSVKSTTNGNQGRLLAQCHNLNPTTGVRCNFFRFFPGSRSPSLSPPLGSSNGWPSLNVNPHGHSAPMPAMQPGPFSSFNTPALGMSTFIPGGGVPPATTFTSSGQPAKPAVVCLTIGCKSSRVRKGCDRRFCKAHCLEAGGCSDAAHKGSQSGFLVAMKSSATPASLANRLASPTTTIRSLPPSQVTASQSTANSSQPTPPEASTNSSGPIYASHMAEVYTAQMAVEQQLRESKRQIEATRLDSKRKVQQTVFVYAWVKDGVSPTPIEVQEGFAWPHFEFNQAILEAAGFSDVSANTRLNFYRFGLGHWTTVRVNHVVELKNQASVFIKATTVTDCKDFQSFLSAVTSSSSSSNPSPHIRTNLAGERAYVKQQLNRLELSNAPTPSFPMKHRLSSGVSTPPPKRIRYVEIDSSPTPPSPPPRRFGDKIPPGGTRIVKKGTRSPIMSFKQYKKMKGMAYDSDESSGPDIIPNPLFKKKSASTSTSTSASSSTSTSALTISANQSLIGEINEEVLDVPTPFIIPSNRVSQLPKWPADFFAVDIVKLFEECEDAKTDSTIRSLFESRFGLWVEYKRTTFHEHRKRWMTAPPTVKEEFRAAGRTEGGCWSRFMMVTTAPRSHTKAHRRQEGKEGIPFVSEDVIDMSAMDTDSDN